VNGVDVNRWHHQYMPGTDVYDYYPAGVEEHVASVHLSASGRVRVFIRGKLVYEVDVRG